MISHQQLAIQLLRDAAGFFQTVAEQNEPVKDQMMENAGMYNHAADLLQNDPEGSIDPEAAPEHEHCGEGEGKSKEGEDGCCGGGCH